MQEICDCKRPGHFYTGVPGILAELQDGCVPPDTAVERCDACERFPTDAAVFEELKQRGLLDWDLPRLEPVEPLTTEGQHEQP